MNDSHRYLCVTFITYYSPIVRMPKDRPQCGLIIEDLQGRVFLQLRDNKPSIPFPNAWGTFGGQIEIGETPEQAIKREISEELSFDCSSAIKYAEYYYDNYWIHMFYLRGKFSESCFVVREGQRGQFLSLEEVLHVPCAFNCREIVEDYYRRFHPTVASKKNID